MVNTLDYAGGQYAGTPESIPRSCKTTLPDSRMVESDAEMISIGYDGAPVRYLARNQALSEPCPYGLALWVPGPGKVASLWLPGKTEAWQTGNARSLQGFLTTPWIDRPG